GPAGGGAPPGARPERPVHPGLRALRERSAFAARGGRPVNRSSLSPSLLAPRSLYRRLGTTGLVYVALVVILAVSAALVSAQGASLFTPANTVDLLARSSPLGFLAVAMTLVIVCRSLDLSVGYVAALSTAVAPAAPAGRPVPAGAGRGSGGPGGRGPALPGSGRRGPAGGRAARLRAPGPAPGLCRPAGRRGRGAGPAAGWNPPGAPPGRGSGRR